MFTPDSQPCLHDDDFLQTRLRGLIQIGLVEAVRIGGELRYRLLPAGEKALSSLRLAQNEAHQ